VTHLKSTRINKKKYVKGSFYKKEPLTYFFFKKIYFLTILGGSLKKIAKKITTRVPISRNVYTNGSIF